MSVKLIAVVSYSRKDIFICGDLKITLDVFKIRKSSISIILSVVSLYISEKII